MKVLSSIILLTLLMVNGSIANAGSAEEWMAKVRASATDDLFTKKELEVHLLAAEPAIKEGSDNPLFWYIVGTFNRELFGYYYDRVNPLGKYSPTSPESQALIQKYQSYYRKTLNADDNPDAPTHLGVSSLSSMASDMLAAPDIKERAYRKMIALIQASGDAVADGYEYTTYQFLLESYSAQKNPDKYLATLNEMIDRFGSSEELAGYKRHVEEVIAKRDQEAAMADTYSQADAYAQPKAAAVQEP
jgi:hypothetical protein